MVGSEPPGRAGSVHGSVGRWESVVNSKRGSPAGQRPTRHFHTGGSPWPTNHPHGTRRQRGTGRGGASPAHGPAGGGRRRRDPVGTSAVLFPGGRVREGRVRVSDVPGCGLVLRQDVFKKRYAAQAWVVSQR